MSTKSGINFSSSSRRRSKEDLKKHDALDQDKERTSSSNEEQFANEAHPDVTKNIFTFEDITFNVSSSPSKRKKHKSGRSIIQNITHSVHTGQMVAILGPSGSGKVKMMFDTYFSCFEDLGCGQYCHVSHTNCLN